MTEERSAMGPLPESDPEEMMGTEGNGSGPGSEEAPPDEACPAEGEPGMMMDETGEEFPDADVPDPEPELWEEEAADIAPADESGMGEREPEDAALSAPPSAELAGEESMSEPMAEMPEDAEFAEPEGSSEEEVCGADADEVMAEDYLQPTGEGVIEVNPADLEVHPHANRLPLMRPSEFKGLCKTIAANGQQVPVILLDGKLLDGRNRTNACAKLRISVRAICYTGSDTQALLYVLNANQYHRDLGKGQCGAVAATLMPLLAEEALLNRIARLRETLRAKRDGECRVLLPDTQTEVDISHRSRDVAADLMGVSATYIQRALRVQRERPDLFEKLWDGTMNMPTALAELEPSEDVAFKKEAASARGRVSAKLRSATDKREFLAALTELLDRFDAD